MHCKARAFALTAGVEHNSASVFVLRLTNAAREREREIDFPPSVPTVTTKRVVLKLRVSGLCKAGHVTGFQGSAKDPRKASAIAISTRESTLQDSRMFFSGVHFGTRSASVKGLSL